MNNFEKRYYLKNKLGLTMTYKEVMQTLDFAIRNNLVDDMVLTYQKYDELQKHEV